MSGPDDGLPGAEAADAAPSVPSAPPSFGHRADQPAAAAAPGGPPEQGPPTAPWWAPSAPSAAAAPAEAEPPGVLVAGPGVPSIDTRRAVPPSLQRSGTDDPSDAGSPDGPDSAETTGNTDTDPNRTVTDGLPAQPLPATVTVTDFPSPAEAMDEEAAAKSEQRLLDSPAAWAAPGAPAASAAQPPSAWNPGQTVVDMAARLPAQAAPPAVEQLPPSPQAAPMPQFAQQPPVPVPQPPKKKRALLYTALALIPALAIGTAAYLLLVKREASAPDPAGPPLTAQNPAPQTPAASSPPPQTPSPGPTTPSVNSSETDPKPLTMTEIFPSRKLRLADRDFVMDRKSLNLRCDYAAHGLMAKTLVKQKCQGLVRSTYVTKGGDKKIGVTVGVVAMPTKKIALAVQKTGTPARKDNWFTGLPGKNSKAVTKAGGHATLTTYGRYVLYVYAQYLDGTKPAKQPKELAEAARAFLAYVNGPLKAR